MSKIITYTKGGIIGAKLDPAKDIVISCNDPNEKAFSPDLNLRLLPLFYSDVNDDALSKIEVYLANRVTTEKKLTWYLKMANDKWPCIPFTPYHAKLVKQFLFETPSLHEKNIHIHCIYGRSRSPATALFISRYLLPNHELIIQRKEALPNSRVFRLLSKEYKVI